MVFNKINLTTGELTPEVFDDRRANLDEVFGLLDTVPAVVQAEWSIALDYYALAVEQANIERFRHYGPLTQDAIFRATIAVEIALRDRLGISSADGRNLYPLVEKAIRAGIVQGPMPLTRKHREQHPDDLGETWDFIIEVRNQYAHGLAIRAIFGWETKTFFRMIGRILNDIYPEVKS